MSGPNKKPYLSKPKLNQLQLKGPAPLEWLRLHCTESLKFARECMTSDQIRAHAMDLQILAKEMDNNE
jgi:hypothetical protein